MKRPMPSHVPSRSAFTIVELLVVIAVVAVLIALLLPAVQSARAAARRTGCRANLKTLATASLAFESTHQRLPGAYFAANPQDNPETVYRGLFIELLPFTDEASRYESLSKQQSIFATGNRDLLQKRPAWLRCPEVPDSADLRGLAAAFSGPAVEGLDVGTVDYAGNGGAYLGKGDDGLSRFGYGTVRTWADGLSRRCRLAEVTDGSSNTLLFWESAGDRYYPRGDRAAQAWLEYREPSVNFIFDTEGRVVAESRGQASTWSFLRSWAAIRVGSVVGVYSDGSPRPAVDVSNRFLEPYSLHAGVCHVAMTDGSVREITPQTDAKVLVQMAQAADGGTDAGAR